METGYDNNHENVLRSIIQIEVVLIIVTFMKILMTQGLSSKGLVHKKESLS